MVAVCGKNEECKAALEAHEWPENVAVNVQGFVSNMDDWMVASDCSEYVCMYVYVCMCYVMVEADCSEYVCMYVFIYVFIALHNAAGLCEKHAHMHVFMLVWCRLSLWVCGAL